MESNVEYLRYTDLPCDRVFDGAIKADLTHVTIVGRQKDGKLYMASSHSKIESTCYDLNKMVRELME